MVLSGESLLAIDGGIPVRESMLPYGRQCIDEDDIQAVVDVLRGDWLTTGPKVLEFEEAFAQYCGAKHAVAVSSGTAALHATMFGLGIEPGDEVIVTPMTFAASANCVVYQGGVPIFADVDPGSMLLDPESVRQKISPRTKAVVAVDYAGQPCNYSALRLICKEYGLALVGDASHALGGFLDGRPVGSLTDLSTFSLHPVKPMTAGEGGVITTDDADLARRMQLFRSHGITTDFRQREDLGMFFYEMTDLGYNYRITDFQCALALSQLAKLQKWINRRQEIASLYDKGFSEIPQVIPLVKRKEVSHGYHLYVVQFDIEKLSVGRNAIFTALRAENIGVGVHYIPVHLHPFYKGRLGYGRGMCPTAEAAYEQLITLPIFPGMSDEDAMDVIRAVRKVVEVFQR